MIVYAIMAEESVGRLFAAGILPGNHSCRITHCCHRASGPDQSNLSAAGRKGHMAAAV